jgi:hypothetical protein
MSEKKKSEKKSTGTSTAAIGAAAIGSAAVAAALLYAGRRWGKVKPDEPTKPGPIPSGEPPQTD